VGTLFKKGGSWPGARWLCRGLLDVVVVSSFTSFAVLKVAPRATRCHLSSSPEPLELVARYQYPVGSSVLGSDAPTAANKHVKAASADVHYEAEPFKRQRLFYRLACAVLARIPDSTLPEHHHTTPAHPSAQ
jgi:hypothetical protein